MNRISNNFEWKNARDIPGDGIYPELGFLKSSGFIPYAGDDVTCGIENEFQTAVSGKSTDVDLPKYINESNYLKNLLKRTARGDLSIKSFSALREYLRRMKMGYGKTAGCASRARRSAPGRSAGKK